MLTLYFCPQIGGGGGVPKLTACVSSLIPPQALHRLEPGSSRKEFNDLCYCLTLPGVRKHPDYVSWTPHLGRLWCFEALRGYLTLIFPGQETPLEVRGLSVCRRARGSGVGGARFSFYVVQERLEGRERRGLRWYAYESIEAEAC